MPEPWEDDEQVIVHLLQDEFWGEPGDDESLRSIQLRLNKLLGYMPHVEYIHRGVNVGVLVIGKEVEVEFP